MIRRHAQASRAELVFLLNACDSPKRMLGSLQGFLLEEVMHSALLSPSPSQLGLKMMNDGETQNITFPVLNEVQFSRMDMSDILNMEEYDYFKPTFPTLTSVESFCILNQQLLLPNEPSKLCIVSFQATMSKRHLLKRSGLKKIQQSVLKVYGYMLDIFVVFVTSSDGVSKRQKLGKTEQKFDLSVKQFLLFGVDFASAFIDGAVIEQGEEAEEEEEEEVDAF